MPSSSNAAQENAAQTTGGRRWSTVNLRSLRLGAGLILLSYVITHFGNHALGLISLQAMETVRPLVMGFWRSPIPTVALYGALAVHGVLALWLLYQRQSLRMPLWEFWQYAFGLALPPLLAGHALGFRLGWWFNGTEGSYARTLLSYVVTAPERGVTQSILLTLAWMHGCIGLHYWLRFRPWYPPARTWLLILALLLPVLSIGGIVAGGRELTVQARTPGWLESQRRGANAAVDPEGAPRTQRQSRSGKIVSLVIDGYLFALAGVFAARGIRSLWQRRRAVRITYPEGRTVTAPVGSSILDASRQEGLPHASVCGGRGRCSTCRVLVINGFASLPPASAAEKQVLASVRAAPDVRLACQTRPVADVSVIPLLPASVSADEAFGVDSRQGHEQRVAVLFADLRGFTRMAERKLPYDTVYILNRYFEAVGKAITSAGGTTNQFTGDGVMALFGIKDGPEVGCRQALAAVGLIVQEMARLSSDLAHDLPEPLRVGIGIHVGPAVIGRMGWKETSYLTAVGDTVHVAARLEQATKDYGAELIVSEDVAVCAGADLSAFASHPLSVRNRAASVTIRVIPLIASLSAGAATAATPDATVPAQA
jgi:adenylate cyclase